MAHIAYLWSTVTPAALALAEGKVAPCDSSVADLSLALLVLIPGTQAWVKTGFWIALGVTVETAFSAPVLVSARIGAWLI